MAVENEEICGLKKHRTSRESGSTLGLIHILLKRAFLLLDYFKKGHGFYLFNWKNYHAVYNTHLFDKVLIMSSLPHRAYIST